MAQKSRKLRELVEEIVSKRPGMTFEIVQSKHYRVILRYRDRSKFAVCAVTPSDKRSNLNARSTIKRLAAELANDEV